MNSNARYKCPPHFALMRDEVCCLICVCCEQDQSVTAAVQSLFLCLGVMFDWDIIYHRRETSSLYLWKAACTHQTLLMTSARVRVSRVIRADEHVQRACTSNNRVVRRCVWSTYMRVCPLACTHTALLLRLLNYEAFGAVVMAPSAFGNMSFYFRLGPNIQFEESSQTIHDLFKRATRGKDEYPWEVTHLTDWSWRQVLFCVFFNLRFLMMLMMMRSMCKVTMSVLCLSSACRRTTIYRSALKWCSKSSWSSTERSKRTEEQQTVYNTG